MASFMSEGWRQLHPPVILHWLKTKPWPSFCPSIPAPTWAAAEKQCFHLLYCSCKAWHDLSWEGKRPLHPKAHCGDGLQRLMNIELVLKGSIFIISNTLEGFPFITTLVNSSRCVAGTAASLTLHSEYLRITHVQHKCILVHIMHICKREMCYTTPHLAKKVSKPVKSRHWIFLKKISLYMYKDIPYNWNASIL